MLPDSIVPLIDLIAREARPRRIILFGSRARGNHRPISDVDLAVEGRACTDETWTRLLVSLAEGAHTLFKVDLVELEKLGPDYQKEIRKDGKVLYESDG
jgi:predicted nucleotidyltransferase